MAAGFVRVDREVSSPTDEYVTTITRSIPWGRQGTPPASRKGKSR